MDAETNFRELFKVLIEQYLLNPKTAQKLLERILKILAEEDVERDNLKSDVESEENDQ